MVSGSSCIHNSLALLVGGARGRYDHTILPPGDISGWTPSRYTGQSAR